MFDRAIRHEFERTLEPPTLGPWKRASAIGNCMRAVIYEMRGIPWTREWSDKTIRNLAWGQKLHHSVQDDLDTLGILIGKEVELRDEALQVTGHIDALIGGEPALAPENRPDLVAFRHALVAEYGDFPSAVVEIKSASSKAMQIAYKAGHPPDHYMIQLGTYKLMADRHPQWLQVKPDEYLLVMVGKDSWGYLVWPLQERWVRKAEERIGLLNRHWREGTLPPCECEWKMKKYCNYPNKTGGCCDDALYETMGK